MTTARWLESAERSGPNPLRSDGTQGARDNSLPSRGLLAIHRSIGPIVRYARGFSTIDTIDVATSALVTSVVRMPSSRPSVARMNENSPIWARAIPTVNATRNGYFVAQTMRRATNGFATSGTARALIARPGDSTRE